MRQIALSATRKKIRQHNTGDETFNILGLSFHLWRCGTVPPRKNIDLPFIVCKEWNTPERKLTPTWIVPEIQGIELGFPMLLAKNGGYTNLIIRWK